jgi:hypothetical protein
MFNEVFAFFKLGSFGNFAFLWAAINQRDQLDAGPLFLNTEENEEKTGTEIKIRKAGTQERMKTSNSQPQGPGAQTPTVADDDLYLFITRDFSMVSFQENGTIPFYRRFFKKVFIREFHELARITKEESRKAVQYD